MDVDLATDLSRLAMLYAKQRNRAKLDPKHYVATDEDEARVTSQRILRALSDQQNKDAKRAALDEAPPGNQNDVSAAGVGPPGNQIDVSAVGEGPPGNQNDVSAVGEGPPGSQNDVSAVGREPGVENVPGVKI